MLTFERATKSDIKGRIGVYGPSGSGKTIVSLEIASGLGDRIAVIDSEHGASNRYADLFHFDFINLENRAIGNYILAIESAGLQGYDVCIIDSLSHAWLAALGIVDSFPPQQKMLGWAKVTPMIEELKNSFLKSPCHIIATFRSKTEWAMEQVNGKVKPREIGLGPVFREGIAYEFDIFGRLEERILYIEKSRCPELQDQSFADSEDFTKLLKAWILPTQGPELSSPAQEPAPRQQGFWRQWKNPGMAIDWAQTMLPDYSRSQLYELFDKVQPDDSGSKKKPWADFVIHLAKKGVVMKEEFEL